MRALIDKNTERVSFRIRADVRVAMEELRVRRCHREGAYVAMGSVFGEAAMVLLKSEGIPIREQPVTSLPVSKATRTLVRRKKAVA